MSDIILLETGDKLLLEDGYAILNEEQPLLPTNFIQITSNIGDQI